MGNDFKVFLTETIEGPEIAERGHKYSVYWADGRGVQKFDKKVDALKFKLEKQSEGTTKIVYESQQEFDFETKGFAKFLEEGDTMKPSEIYEGMFWGLSEFLEYSNDNTLSHWKDKQVIAKYGPFPDKDSAVMFAGANYPNLRIARG